ncbi:MAG: type IV secretory system conjugative DNA transfer family protein [Deltaproteobacteria bacterium]|nr:type IV secretory system conjugative DNA transfer family protein [Deltaproteobacteria bacterium]
MLQLLEIKLLELVRWYFSLPPTVSLITLGTLSVWLVIKQYSARRHNNYLPGVLAAICLIPMAMHFIDRSFAIKGISNLIHDIQQPVTNRAPVPVFEWFFEIFVAPYELRSFFEEILFVALFAYLLLVGIHSVKEYRKTGILIGDLSLASIMQKEYQRPQRSKSNELGSGDLADFQQISKWTRPTGKTGDTSLPVTDLRGSEGTAFKTGKLVIPREDRNRHILTVAKTGSGKTTRLILPILYHDCMCPVRSTIVIDSKPEMWRKLAAMTAKYNPTKNIMLFNPLDRARSLSWNILSKIEDDTDAKLIANTIIMATDVPSAKSDSPFFRNNALAVLNSLMVGLLHDGNEVLSMPRIHELVQSGMKPLCDWLEAHPHAYRNTRTFVELARSGSQNADTIMSELSMRLSAWDLTAIRATTSMDELDIEDLIEKPSLFIVELRESELEMLRPMANVIVVEILRYLTKRAESCPGTTLPRPVGLVIDEFASALGRLPDIHVKLNTLRSRNVSIVAAIQSIAQVKANYGDDADSVLAGFSTKILMPALDIQDAEWASKETGQMTIRFQTASTGSNKKLTEVFASNNDGTQEQVQQRAVLTPDEIGRPADNICTFFMPNTPVFQGHLVPFYKVAELRQRLGEFDSEEKELKLRAAPIRFEEKSPEPSSAAAAAPGAVGSNGLPPGISDSRGWTDDKILDTLAEVKKKLDWDNTTGSARKWWEAFENENKHRNALVLRLAEELAVRKATITEFFLAYVYSNTDNIQANLHYLDYTRLKKEEERKKREAAQKARDDAQAAPPGDSSQPAPDQAAA